MIGYIDPKGLYYSEIFHSGIYAHCEGDVVSSPVPDTLNTTIVKNILTNATFFCKKIHISSSEQKKILINEILHPGLSLASWPVDLISITGGAKKDDHIQPVSVAHRYSDNYHVSEEKNANYILLFPYNKRDLSGRGGYAYYTPLAVWLEKEPINQRNYNNDKIKKICFGIVRTLYELNKEGYAYYDFSLSRFMVRSDLSVVPEYTNLLSYECRKTKSDTKELTAKYGNIPLEYIEPFLYFRENEEHNNAEDVAGAFGFITQNYSLAAMLFDLMFARKPYEGQRLMQNQDDRFDEVGHYAYLKNLYLKNDNIHFIFDDTYNNPNLLSDRYTDMFSDDIKLWKACPAEIRELFVNALCRQNALREHDSLAPKPEDWIHTFERLKWGI